MHLLWLCLAVTSLLTPLLEGSARVFAAKAPSNTDPLTLTRAHTLSLSTAVTLSRFVVLLDLCRQNTEDTALHIELDKR
ncbi:hypothetical protein LSTR_LSTR003340 [Laodelphax striatellus]|uniref:Uncharacterized protein n=1 Tax=Laodelphax striatellus TaxID=195883 RepID=A0A482X5Z7_LAOST|nr:hypothetical protein LSTR_LSTR003340 [Laodelphax striatellus]